MKNKLLFILALFTSSIYSQNYQTVVVEDDDNTNKIERINKEEIESAAKEIVAQIGLPQNFVLRPDSSFKNNAKAEMITGKDGRTRRYVTYDPNFFNKINEDANNKWAAISILAHEIGHHLNNHSLNNDGSKYAYELEADKWSGFVLRKMGASLEDAQSAILTLKESKRPSKTHPPKKERLLSIEKGWRSGQKGLDKFTPEDEITSVMVIDKYFNAIGGKKVAEGIQSLTFKEKMEQEDEITKEQYKYEYFDILKGFGDFEYMYLNQNTFIKESKKDGTRYLVTNNQLYHKNFDSKKPNAPWVKGDPYQNNIHGDILEFDFKKHVLPAPGSINFELPLIETNESLPKFKSIKTFNGVPSYVLENIAKNEKQLKGKRLLVNETITTRYYNIDTGLLHAVVEVNVKSELKNDKVKNVFETTLETIIEDYSLETELLFPHRFTTKEVKAKNGYEIENNKVVRTIYDLNLNPILDLEMFKTD